MAVGKLRTELGHEPTQMEASEQLRSGAGLLEALGLARGLFRAAQMICEGPWHVYGLGAGHSVVTCCLALERKPKLRRWGSSSVRTGAHLEQECKTSTKRAHWPAK